MEESDTERVFIHFKDRGDKWKDVTPVPQFSDDVEILRINYDAEYREVNDYFRAIMLTNEISTRAYELTTEIILVFNFITLS